MLRIRVLIGPNGLLKEATAEGHAAFAAKGQDIVCAAASVLLRTVARTFQSAEGFLVEGEAAERGSLEFSLLATDDADTRWGRGVTEMFVKGIGDLADEFPDNIELTITND